MTNSTHIFVDAAGDFPKELLLYEHVSVIPMDISMNDHIFSYSPLASHEETMEVFYRDVATGALPTTTMVSAYFFEELFEPLLRRGEHVLYICLSSSLSGMYEQALLAKRSLEEKLPDGGRLFLVDSLTASGGLGLLLEDAIRLRDEGLGAEEIAKEIDRCKGKVAGICAVEDLFHLKRGGRITAVGAFLGTALKVKPLLHIDGMGRLIPFGKSRGMQKALRELTKLYQERRVSKDRVIITHADCREHAEKLAQSLAELSIPSTIVPVSPIIASHTGRGMVGLFFRGWRVERDAE